MLLNISPDASDYYPSSRELSDVDKDGQLSLEEFSIAMHLIEKAKSGLVLPKTLPSELSPGGALKQGTLERQVSGEKERVRKLSEGEGLTFEDKRKMNFELGRMELDRRRKAVVEAQEREKVWGGGGREGGHV